MILISEHAINYDLKRKLTGLFDLLAGNYVYIFYFDEGLLSATVMRLLFDCNC